MGILHTFRQLLRQPLRLISGILVISLAVSILSVCLGQAIAAVKTEENLDDSFTTIALSTTKYQYTEQAIGGVSHFFTSNQLPQDIIDLIEQTKKEHPELVKSVSSPGLASAYIKQLTPDNVTYHNYFYPYRGSQEVMIPHRMEATPTYACAMLEIVLDEIGEPIYFPEVGVKEDGTEVSFIYSVTVDLCGTVQGVASLEDGYDDPTGRKIHISMELPSLESLDELNLQVGGRYIVFGYDYLDGDWALRGKIAEELGEKLGYHIDYREINTDKIIYSSDDPNDPDARYSFGGKSENLTKDDLKLVNAVTLTVKDNASFGKTKSITHDGGKYYVVDYTRHITDEKGNNVQISEAEWQARYKIPTIARLDGTVEEFLASDEGALWKKQLEYNKINYHAFPIIGVEKMGYIADFARGNARIVDGRDFTSYELKNGKKVCLLSESLAVANGISVGDKITPRFYNYDYDSPNQDFLSKGIGVVNPYAYRFSSTTAWANSDTYTVIGLYRQNNAWGDVSDNLYSFTPNTVFVPKASVKSDMDCGEHAFFRTLVLHNGAVEEFRKIVDDAGYEGAFVYYDGQYSVIAGTLMNYREVAQRAIVIGALVYAVILLLFLLLFPGSQGRVLNTMNALGAKRRDRMAQVLLNGAGILLPGTLIGVVFAMPLWNNVVSGLAKSVGESVTLEMEIGVLIAIALAQLALALLVTALLSLPMTKNSGIRKRK